MVTIRLVVAMILACRAEGAYVMGDDARVRFEARDGGAGELEGDGDGGETDKVNGRGDDGAVGWPLELVAGLSLGMRGSGDCVCEGGLAVARELWRKSDVYPSVAL